VLTSAAFPWWLSPILVGLLSAIPLSVFTSRARIGRALRRRGLLLTPEESREPRILQAARRAGAAVAERLASFRAAVADHGVQAQVVAALPHRPAASGAKGVAETHRIDRALREGPAALARGDGLRLLSSRTALAVMYRDVVAHAAHPDWWRATESGPLGDEPGGARDQRTAETADGSHPEPAVEPL
jgi:membrane glycosyltransferase